MIHTKLLSKFAFSLALVLAIVTMVTSVPVRLEAQAISGDLTGKVVDASGAVVPNATVEAVNLATSQKITTTTNSSGEYHFTNMPVGHYKMTAAANGMSGGYADIRVDLNKTATANITATVGAAATTVEVVEQAATIDTTTAQIQTNYDVKQAQDLPTASVGLGVLNLSLLQAGVASSGGVGAGTGPSVSGQRPRNNNFSIEGVDNNSKSVTGPLVTIPNDAVENFTVLQNNFSPEFGHSSGGQFNQVVASGTNRFHGKAYEYFQNRNLNAQDSQNVLSGLKKNPRFDNNRFGGQIGGPIFRDKLFFFSNHEYNPIGQVGSASSACAPTGAGFTAIAAVPGVVANNLQTMQKYLPAASAVGGGGCPSAITVGGSSIPVGSIGFNGPSYSNTYTTVNSIDSNLSSKDQLRFRYIYSRFTGFDTAAQLPTFFIAIPARYHVGTLSEYHTFSPKITNEFRFGFNRYAQVFPVPAITFPGLSVFPNLTLRDLKNVNIGPDGNAPQGAIQNLYQATDNITWLMGKHNVKFGIEGRKWISPQTFTQRVRGDYRWTNTQDYLFDKSPDNFGERSTGNPLFNGDQYAIYAFGNDEYRVTSHLTLNLGLRYEFTQVPAALGYQALNAIASVPGFIDFRKPQAQKKNFAPRIGFAYSPGASGETSIRGGFAMAYDVIYDNLPLLSLPPELSSTCDASTANPPTATCPYSTTAFLANGGLPSGSNGLTIFPTQAAAAKKTAAFVPDQKLPYSESWNIGVQHIFHKSYIAEVRYVGTKGLHLPVQVRMNRQTKITDTLFLPTYTSNPGQAALDALGVTLAQLTARSNFKSDWAANNFSSASVVSFQPYGQSNYHGLQTQLNRNFTNGLQLQLAWTWSHAFDNSTADVFSTLLTPRRAQDWNCFKCDMSTSALDRRHRITFQMIYDMPFFKKDSNWFKKNVIGNWEVAPIYTFQSPEYAVVQSDTDSNLNGDAAGDRTVLNYGGDKSLGSTVTALKNTAGQTVAYLADNPKAYYIQAGPGAKATAPRNTLPLPRINNWDMTVVKRFGIREGMNVEFQAQAFNIFNHTQYVPGSLNQINSLGYTGGETQSFVSVDDPAFNQANLAFSNQPRSMQLALKFTF